MGERDGEKELGGLNFELGGEMIDEAGEPIKDGEIILEGEIIDLLSEGEKMAEYDAAEGVVDGDLVEYTVFALLKKVFCCVAGVLKDEIVG